MEEPDTATKASFDAVYDRPDPRAYMTELAGLDYQVPHHGQQVFRRVLAALDAADRGRATVVDLCCSYGINGALLGHDVELGELYARYGAPATAALSRDELVAADRAFYAERRRPDAPRMVGVDVAPRAVAYALDVGLLHDAAAEDLEHRDPSPALAAAVADADLVTVTGGIGYITERTFGRVVAAVGRRPWVAALCLRTIPFAPIARTLDGFGLVTERLAGHTVPQRRFVDDQERSYALAALAELGLDPAGKEAEGSYHAEVFLARPAEDVRRLPIDRLLDGVT